MGETGIRPRHPLHQHFHLAAGLLAAEDPRRNHPGIIEYQQITGPQPAGQVTEPLVLQLTTVTAQTQQPAVGALLSRVTGNQSLR